MAEGGPTALPPLAGVRVLDLATMMAAPAAAAYLAEFGADVIKVEKPGEGDPQRRWGTRKAGESVYWKSISRNKRSLTLDLRTRGGAEILRLLVGRTDVVIANFRPGTLDAWGIGYEWMAAANPGVILLEISGFGQAGPLARRPGFGTLAEARSGFAHLTGQPDGPPTLPNMGLADGVAGIMGAFAVMLALRARERGDGLGQRIDLSLCDSVLRLIEPSLLDWSQLGIAGQRTGSRSVHVAPRNVYRCRDGNWVALSASTPSIARRVFAAIGRPELADDPRFADNASRLENVEELDAVIGEWIGRHPASEVIEIMERAEAAVGPVQDIPQIHQDPSFRERPSFVEVEDPHFGQMQLVDVVPKLSRTPGRVSSTGPALGQHTKEILEELGLLEEHPGLEAEGVV
ncbi:MAG: CaiB/BaiF CoA transferase family protein [Candidatus Dormibacteria bacterium]